MRERGGVGNGKREDGWGEKGERKGKGEGQVRERGEEGERGRRGDRVGGGEGEGRKENILNGSRVDI